MTEHTDKREEHSPDSADPHMPAIDTAVLRRSLKTIMKPAITCAIDTPINQAIFLMQTKRIGCVLVTSRNALLGIFTERDVLKKIIGSSFDLKAAPLSEVMTVNPHALYEDDTIAYAMNFMDLGGYRHIPVVNRDFEPVGVVSVKDIVSYFVNHFADEVLNLPPHQATVPEAPAIDEEGLLE